MILYKIDKTSAWIMSGTLGYICIYKSTFAEKKHRKSLYIYTFEHLNIF